MKARIPMRPAPAGSRPGRLPRRSLLAASAVAALGGEEPPPMGWGPCSRCRCPGFRGNEQACGNCGHAYRDHWL